MTVATDTLLTQLHTCMPPYTPTPYTAAHLYAPPHTYLALPTYPPSSASAGGPAAPLLLAQPAPHLDRRIEAGGREQLRVEGGGRAHQARPGQGKKG